MATSKDAVRLDVSVYLLRKSQVALAQSGLQGLNASIYTLIEDIPEGVFIALPAEPMPPKWLDHVSTLLAAGQQVEIESQAPGALLWVPRDGRTFVLTFGYGHSKIKDEWVEPEFGKTVALSVIPQGKVVEVRSEQVFAKRHIASERAPRASAVREFGFESDRDLVAAVEGVPESTYSALFGPKVRGGVALRLGLDFTVLLKTLDQIIERFDSNDHKQRWPQANNLVVVRDADKIEELDMLLADLLVQSNPEQLISLAAPNERSGDKPYPQHFTIGRMSANAPTAPYLLFGNWLSCLSHKGLALNLDAANSTPVHLLDENREKIGSCTIYQCFGTDVSLNGQPYVLSSGVWYAADQQFIAETNAALSALAAPRNTLPAWNGADHEGAYNAGVCKIDQSLWLFDKELVNFGGGASSFEFCDLMHLPTRTLYFVKHPTGSAGVSHLCEQVRRTAENFFMPDPSFRNKLAAKLAKAGKGWDSSWLSVHPKRHEWKLCLVLMGKQVSALPFFAKCGVARLLRELERGGYNVQFQAV